MGHILLSAMLLLCTMSFLAAQNYVTIDPKEGERTHLQIVESQIVVDGKAAKILQLQQPNGKVGMIAHKGDSFDVLVENRLKDEASVIHWHGLLVPYAQDGVAYVSQEPIPPGQAHGYHFLLRQTGTYWMHGHYEFQEQRLLAAPLILLPPRSTEENSLQMQEVVLLLQDFTFEDPMTIFQNLREGTAPHLMNRGSDVKYDAYLTNLKTLSEPEQVHVVPETLVRLRIINASASTNFFIELDTLEGRALSVDGRSIEPFVGSSFELATAQRIDLLVTIPKGVGAYPILARAESTDMQTGLVLVTTGGKVPVLSGKASTVAESMLGAQERRLRATNPLDARPIDRKLQMRLGGSMKGYIWTINGKQWPDYDPLRVKQGERVEITFINETDMSHPMHLHGHTFQVTEIDGERFSGAMRDTVLVGPKSTVKIQFDAESPGYWAFHCHNLYHQEGGMMTLLVYDDYDLPPPPPSTADNI